MKISISGTSAWKVLEVTDKDSGEVIIEKKFYKNDFGEIMKDAQFKPFVDKVIEAAYTTGSGGAPAASTEGESPASDEGEHEEEAA